MQFQIVTLLFIKLIFLKMNSGKAEIQIRNVDSLEKNRQKTTLLLLKKTVEVKA